MGIFFYRGTHNRYARAIAELVSDPVIDPTILIVLLYVVRSGISGW